MRRINHADWIDQWILFPDLHHKLVEILLHARLRQLPTGRAVEELRFLYPFGFHERSESAIESAKATLSRVALVEQLTQQIVEKIGPLKPREESETLLTYSGNGRATYILLDPNSAVITIEFLALTGLEKYPELTEGAQHLRDQALVGVENPPKIYIEVKGLNDYHFSEREEE